jgi:TRAP-type C4-dicarboxylate transport system substrate-binding protein
MAARRHHLLVLLLAAALASGCAGSSGSSDKAGGSSSGTIVLRLAVTPAGLNQLPAVEDFIQRVKELSHDTIRIRPLTSWGGFLPGAEAQLVHAVASGAVDLGVTRSNVFDTLGVSSFTALSTPMLIDSYPLENAVLESTIPERMLAGLSRLGVGGLAVLGDQLRVPISVHHPLLAPGDWRGLTFGTYRSKTQEQVIRALGATPFVVFGPFRNQALAAGKIQAFEQDVEGAKYNALVRLAPYFAANVALWPEIDVLLSSPSRLRSLTEQQRAWITEAAHGASRDSATLASEDSVYVREDCAAGARFVNATSADLAAMRRALSPVYAQLETDPQTRAFIEEIHALKDGAPRGPVIRVPAQCWHRR